MTLLDDYVHIGWRTVDGGQVQSSFSAAVRDARQVTGRDTETGEVVDPGATGAWIGAVGWLCFFDQVGTAVKLAERSAEMEACLAGVTGVALRFHLALVQFVPELDRAAFDALYALRNSLAHDYSLANYPPRGGQPTHVFNLRSEDRRWVVDYGLVAHGGPTQVNLRGLGDLGEEVCAGVRQAHDDGRLLIAVDESQFEHRYFMAT